MFVWFIVTAVVAVAFIFDSPAMDFRLVAFGAALPVAEGAMRGPWLLHTPIAAVVLLAGVMLLAQGRRLVQRRWLGVPIGLMAHLVLDGTWTDTGVFWWPFAGLDALGGSRVPEFNRGATGLLLEAAGLIIGVWAWRRFGLGNRTARRLLLSEGRLSSLRRT
jgi:hypothetical protein|tara:strand:+ start:948 stop:1433 length:486 start_codon:yes stop_codon:yes gene_type:complete